MSNRHRSFANQIERKSECGPCFHIFHETLLPTVLRCSRCGFYEVAGTCHHDWRVITYLEYTWKPGRYRKDECNICGMCIEREMPRGE